MNEVRVNLYGKFREISGKKVACVRMDTGSSLRDLIDKLCMEEGDGFRHALLDPRTGEPRCYICLLINGRHNRYLGGLNAVLNAGDVIDVLLPAVGG